MTDLQDLKQMALERPDTFDLKASGVLKLINEIERLRELATQARAERDALAAQPVSAGLTDAEIRSVWDRMDWTTCTAMDFGRALLSAAQQSSQPVADTSADARDAALAEIHKFLLGEGPLDGLWYGDVDTDKPRKRYWWRSFLRGVAIAASREAP